MQTDTFLKDKYSRMLFNDEDLKDYIMLVVSKIIGVDKKVLEDNFEIKNTLLQSNKEEKISTVDALYETEEYIINLEINFKRTDIIERKNTRYRCQLISKQIKRGDKYYKFKPVTTINLNNYDYYRKGEFIYKTTMREEKYNLHREKDLEIIYDISLDLLRKINYNEIKEKAKDSIERLLYILVCNNEEERNILYRGDDIMEKVNKKISVLDNLDLSDMFMDEEEFSKAYHEEIAYNLGRESTTKEFVKNCLKSNMKISKIMELTGLTKEEIEELK